MNGYLVPVYLVYLAISVGLVVWLARTLFRNGAVFLEEEITLAALAGLVLVLAGVALGTGAVGRTRRSRRASAASLTR